MAQQDFPDTVARDKPEVRPEYGRDGDPPDQPKVAQLILSQIQDGFGTHLVEVEKLDAALDLATVRPEPCAATRAAIIATA